MCAMDDEIRQTVSEYRELLGHKATDWVAESIFGYERKSCQGAMGGGSIGTDHSESFFWCDWCGQRREHNTTRISVCPEYPFPRFTMRALMAKLGEMGRYTHIRYDANREDRHFTVILDQKRVCDTNSPLMALCIHLYKQHT